MSDPIVKWTDEAGPGVETARYVAAGAVVRAGAYVRLVVALVASLFTGRALLGVAVTDTPGRTERAVAATFGLGCLLAGPVVWVLLPTGGDATLVVGYLTAIGAPFGIVLLRYAAVV